MNADAGTARNLSADRLDGRDSADFARAYRRTVVVSPVGTPVQNGTALKDALSGITGASESKPYLLKIEPGVYDLGTAATPLRMKPYVDVEGSGEGVTRLTATGIDQEGTVVGAANSELRSLTVENTADPTDPQFSRAITTESGPFRITHVTATASGGDPNTIGVVIDGGTTTLSRVTIEATGDGGGYNAGVVVLSGASAVLGEVTASASGEQLNGTIGLSNTGQVRVRNSRLEGETRSVSTNRSSNDTTGTPTTRIGASQLAGGPVGGDGTTTCAGVYDENYVFSASTCHERPTRGKSSNGPGRSRRPGPVKTAQTG